MSEILFKTHNTIETFNDNLGNKEDLAICEYNGEKLQRRIALEKHKWFCADIPEDLLNKEINQIIPYYGQITVEVEKYDYEKE